MFALEAAQAGFIADFKSLELNTFGGLYTKYLKYNYSIADRHIDCFDRNLNFIRQWFNRLTNLHWRHCRLCMLQPAQYITNGCHDFSRLLEQLLIFLSTFMALNFQPFLTL
ncbi:hypothetical protein T09_3528 [Trichinella sp. T9]|nr:hypothetical protein T09_3528 [Trichinella sp. T9]